MKNYYPTTINKKIIGEIKNAKKEDWMINASYDCSHIRCYRLHLPHGKTYFEITLYIGGSAIVKNRDNGRWDSLWNYLSEEESKRFWSLADKLDWSECDSTPVIEFEWREAMEYIECLCLNQNSKEFKSLVHCLSLAIGKDVIKDAQGKLQVKGYRRHSVPCPCFTWEEVENGKAKEILEALS